MKIKERLIYFLARHLLPTIEDKDIISFVTRGVETVVFIDNVKLSPQDIRNLQAEVKFFEESMLWKLMNTQMIKQAQKKIYNESKDITDLLFGKTILYTLSVQDTILKNIKNTKI